MSDSDCCNKAPPDAKGSGGTVMCCNGKKVACLFNQYKGPEPWAGLVAACKKKHEEKHFDDVECGSGTYAPGFGPRRPQAMGECEGYQLEMNCLKESLKKCGSSVQCQNWLKNTIESLHTNAQQKGFGCVFR